MNNLTAERRDEMIEEVQVIQDELAGLVERLESIVREMGNGYLREYLVVQLKIRVDSEHGYLTDDPSLDSVIEALEEMDAEEGSPDEDGWDEEE